MKNNNALLIKKLESRIKSLEQSIISACETVGKDKNGKMPFNANDLAERILEHEKEKTCRICNKIFENNSSSNVFTLQHKYDKGNCDIYDTIICDECIEKFKNFSKK